MHRRHPIRLSLCLLALLVASMAVPAAAATAAPAAERQQTTVMWHAQQAMLGRTGKVNDARATLVRHPGGIAFRLHTEQLTPGHVYTLWLVTIDNPEACASVPCSPADVLLDPDTAAQVSYAAGIVAGGSGKGTLAGATSAGEIEGWFDDRHLTDPLTVEVHLVLNHHGPKVPGMVGGMLSTYRGGSADDSPFPAIYPQAALDDGLVGPNECRLYQAAIFLP